MKEMEMFFLVPRRDKEMFLRIQFAWFLVDEGVPGSGTGMVLWQGWCLMLVVHLQVAFENGCLSFHRAHSCC